MARLWGFQREHTIPDLAVVPFLKEKLNGCGVGVSGFESISAQLGTPNLLYNGYRVSFLEVKRPMCGVDNPHRLAQRTITSLCLFGMK